MSDPTRPHVTTIGTGIVTLALLAGGAADALAQDESERAPDLAEVADASAFVVDLEPRILDLAVTIEDLAGGTTETVTPEQVEIRLDTSVFFAVDEATLQQAARDTLRDVADQMGTDGAAGISVVGHTDSTNTAQYNQDLSERRAAAVAEFLGERLDGVGIDASGRGEQEPIAPNEREDGSPDEEGRARNRRVEITYTTN